MLRDTLINLKDNQSFFNLKLKKNYMNKDLCRKNLYIMTRYSYFALKIGKKIKSDYPGLDKYEIGDSIVGNTIFSYLYFSNSSTRDLWIEKKF